MGHWWTRSDSVEAPSGVSTPTAPVEAGWRSLPPIQRVLTPTPAVAPLHTFASSLVTAQNPSLLAPLGHSLDLAGPSGQVDGLAAPVPTTYAAADPLPLNVQAESPRRVQRMLAGLVAQRVLSSPVAQRVLTSPAAQAAAAIPVVSQVIDTVTAASPPPPPVVTGPTSGSANTPDTPEPLGENSSLPDLGQVDDPFTDLVVADPDSPTPATAGPPPPGPPALPGPVQRTVAPALAPPPIATALPLLGEASDAGPIPSGVGPGVPSSSPPAPASASTSPLAAAVSPSENAPAGRPTSIEPAVQRVIPAPTTTVSAVPPTPAPVRTFGADTPMKTSAPTTIPTMPPALPVAQRLSTDPGSGPRTTAPTHTVEPAHQHIAPAGPTPPSAAAASMPETEATGPTPVRPLLTESEPLVDVDDDVPAAVRIGDPIGAPVQRAMDMPALVGLEHLLGGSGTADAAPMRSVARARIGLPVVPSTPAQTPSSAGAPVQRAVLGLPDTTEWSTARRSDTGVGRPAAPPAPSTDHGAPSLPTTSLQTAMAGPLASAALPMVSRIADPAGPGELGPSLPGGPAWSTVSPTSETGATPLMSRAVDATRREPSMLLSDPAPAGVTGAVLPSFPLASVPPTTTAVPAAVSRPLLAQRVVDPVLGLAGAFRPAPGGLVPDVPSLSVANAPPIPGRPSPMHSGLLAAATPGPVAQRVADDPSVLAPTLRPSSLEPGMTVLRSIDLPTAGSRNASLPGLSPVVPTGAYPVLTTTPTGPTASARSLPLAMPAPLPAPTLAGDAAVNAGVAQRLPDNSVQFAPPAESSSGFAFEAPVQRMADVPVVQTAPAATAAAGGGEGALPTDLDELARRLFDPLSARLKTELWLDRERAGLISELRR